MESTSHPQKKTADSWRSSRYLIGPAWFGAYLSLLKTLLACVPAIVLTVMLAVGLAQQLSLTATIVQAVTATIGTAFHIVFWVTVTFAFLERSTADPKEFITEKKPEATDVTQRQVSLSESIASAVCIAIGLGWLAFAPILHVKDGHPLLHPGLGDFWIPLLLALMSFSLIHRLFLIRTGQWTTTLTVTHAILGAFGIFFLLALVSTQEIINPAYLEAWGVGDKAADIIKGLHWSAAIVAAITVVTTIWEIVQAFRLNRRLKNT